MDWGVILSQASVTLEMTEEVQVGGDQSPNYQSSGHWDGTKM